MGQKFVFSLVINFLDRDFCQTINTIDNPAITQHLLTNLTFFNLVIQILRLKLQMIWFYVMVLRRKWRLSAEKQYFRAANLLFLPPEQKKCLTALRSSNPRGFQLETDNWNSERVDGNIRKHQPKRRTKSGSSIFPMHSCWFQLLS